MKSDQDQGLRVKVKTARSRTLASTLWLERQLNDPYVVAAKKQGFRSRSAFKLIEIDDQLKFLLPGLIIVDLGAAPGGWCQVAASRVNARASNGQRQGKVIGIDLLDIIPIDNVTTLKLDFLESEAGDKVKALAGDKVDVVLSDMAAVTTGHRSTDHLRTIRLAQVAWDFASGVLAPNGVFIAKVFQGGTEGELLHELKQHFAKVRHIKPPASRRDSSEVYVVATGFS